MAEAHCLTWGLRLKGEGCFVSEIVGGRRSDDRNGSLGDGGRGAASWPGGDLDGLPASLLLALAGANSVLKVGSSSTSGRNSA